MQPGDMCPSSLEFKRGHRPDSRSRPLIQRRSPAPCIGKIITQSAKERGFNSAHNLSSCGLMDKAPPP